MNERQSEWFNKMRKEWMEVMLPFSGFSAGELFERLNVPPPELLDGCVMLSSRDEILNRLQKGGICAELGTQQGYFSERIIQVCAPDELHLFDIDFTPLFARGQTATTGIAQLHEGDSSTLLAEFPEEYFDWIYVDGDHSPAGIARDLAVAKTRVKKGGLLIFNDFTMGSPVECIYYGIPQAVCGLSTEEKWPFIYYALHPLMYCDVAIRRPK